VSKPVVIFIAGLLLAASASAGPAMSFDQPDTTFASNVAIDILRFDNAIWMATSNGLNYSRDSGRTWLLYNSGNGLVSSDVSAVNAINGRLWAATNHLQDVQGTLNSYSDGVSYSDDAGLNWTRVRFDQLNPVINYVYGAFRTIYDIGGANNRVFFSAFAGGLLSSADTGKTWKRLFASKADSINFSDFYGGLTGDLKLRNEYFSCAADTSHGDSFFVWAGTAGGIVQYIFLQPKDKFAATQVHALALSTDSNFLFAGGNTYLARGSRLGQRFSSRTDYDGDVISATTTIGDRLLLGVYSGTAASPGPPFLMISDDQGVTFSPATISGTGVIHEFGIVRNRLYAASDSGLFVSPDSGSNWSRIWVDSTNTAPANRRNIVNGLSSLGDTLWLGTDSGLVTLRLDNAGVIDSIEHYVFPENDTSGSRVIRLRVQDFGGDSLGIWAVNRAATISGAPVVRRWSASLPGEWITYQVNEITNDVAFTGDSVYFLQRSGVRMTSTATDPATYILIRDSVDNTIVVSDNNATSSPDSVFCMIVKGDTLILGTGGGIAVSTNRGRSYKVTRAQLNPNVSDISVNYTYLNTLNVKPGEASRAGMTGDFVPSLYVQYVSGGTARIFASCRRVDYGADGVSWGRSILDTINNVEVRHYRWDPVYTEGFAWNFESLGNDTLLLATDNSLLVIAHPGDTLQQTVDSLVFKSKRGQDLLFGGTPIYSVRADHDLIWVGTDDGTIRIDRASLGSARLFIVTDPADEVYAFPTPFSPQRDERVRFHFKVKQTSNVTLEVYDFAMNLVNRPLDNVNFAAGIYPPGDPEDSERPYWDGRNGRGDLVAVGVYYFKVTYSTGEVQWGKLAVIP
jgi:hypothetical protein